jgi:cytochrome P450
MTVAMEQLPFLDIDAPGFFANPLPAVEEARQSSWVARSSRGHEVLSYAGCEAALHNRDLHHGARRLLEQMGVDRSQIVPGGGRNFLFAEGQDHTELRRAVSRWFTPRQVDRLRDRVRDLVESLIDPFTAAGGGEFMRDVARHLPGAVFCWMVGARGDQGDRLYELSERLQPAFSGDPDEADALLVAGAEMRTFIDDLVDSKRREPDDALISILLAAADAGELQPADVFSVSMELLGASTDNTANSAGLALNLLASHPGEWQRLGSDRSLVHTAVEECARYDPRITYVNQWTPDGTALLDLELPADTDIWLWFIGGCFDPAVYPDPHHFDVGRVHAKPQLNFGAGRHFCIGAALARMELQVLLEVLAERWATVAPAGASTVQRNVLGVSVEHLPLAVTPR